MKKHTGLSARLNAWFLHKGSERYNRRVDERKKTLLSDLKGRVLEIGPGTGANLKYYPKQISLIGLEPNPFMQSHLKEKAEELYLDIEIITDTAEDIPLADGSVDGVASTLVLCSVDNLNRALAEIKRILKPGGRFVFIEHVAAPKKTFLRRLQQGVEPLWRRMADGCHPDCETWKAIESAGFQNLEIEHFRLSLPIVGPHIMGKAVK